MPPEASNAYSALIHRTHETRYNNNGNAASFRLADGPHVVGGRCRTTAFRKRQSIPANPAFLLLVSVASMWPSHQPGSQTGSHSVSQVVGRLAGPGQVGPLGTGQTRVGKEGKRVHMIRNRNRAATDLASNTQALCPWPWTWTASASKEVETTHTSLALPAAVTCYWDRALGTFAVDVNPI